MLSRKKKLPRAGASHWDNKIQCIYFENPDGKAAGVAGVSPDNIIWMLCTEASTEFPHTFVREARRWVDSLPNPYLCNVADMRNESHIKLLKLLENDTVEIDNNEITYFDLKFELTKKSFDIRKQDFSLFPKVQTDSNSDMIVFSPDVKTHLLEDLYVHVRTYPDPDQEIKWSEKDSMYVKINETFF